METVFLQALLLYQMVWMFMAVLKEMNRIIMIYRYVILERIALC